MAADSGAGAGAVFSAELLGTSAGWCASSAEAMNALLAKIVARTNLEIACMMSSGDCEG
ncbi:hypothetical protein D3C80_2186340 [compost metagenome]